MPERTAGRLDDEEPIGGSGHDTAVDVCGRDDELVHAPVPLGDDRHPVPAARPRAFAAKPGGETGVSAVPGAPRFAQRE
jgi:hypothetical protein